MISNLNLSTSVPSEINLTRMVDNRSTTTQEWNDLDNFSQRDNPCAKHALKVVGLVIATGLGGLVYTYYPTFGKLMLGAAATPLLVFSCSAIEHLQKIDSSKKRELEKIRKIYREVIQYIEKKAEDKVEALIDTFNRAPLLSRKTQEAALNSLRELEKTYDERPEAVDLKKKLRHLYNNYKTLPQLENEYLPALRRACLKYLYGYTEDHKQPYVHLKPNHSPADAVDPPEEWKAVKT